jgi:hypothetical protein
MSLIEQFRKEALEDVFSLAAFKKGWPKRRTYIRSLFENPDAPTRTELVTLGSHLAEVFETGFKAGKATGRSQKALSQAGAVWEGLVVWYINLCLAGTHAVCVRSGKLCPAPLVDALSVVFEASILRSEADVALISLPEAANEPTASSRGEMMTALTAHVGKSFNKSGLLNLQCKTNWKDNAQIPMLWNMLYNQARKGAIIPNGFTIGRNSYALRNLGHFGYGFVTVPTGPGSRDFNANRLEVLRVKTMTAGNYWGLPNKQGVCSSLGEIFNTFNKNSQVFPNVADVGLGFSIGAVGGVPVNKALFKL